MRLRISIRGRVRPSVRPSVRRSVGPYVPCYFRTSKNDIYEAPMTTKVNRDYVQVSKNNDDDDDDDDDDDNDDDDDDNDDELRMNLLALPIYWCFPIINPHFHRSDH